MLQHCADTGGDPGVSTTARPIDHSLLSVVGVFNGIINKKPGQQAHCVCQVPSVGLHRDDCVYPHLTDYCVISTDCVTAGCGSVDNRGK